MFLREEASSLLAGEGEAWAGHILEGRGRRLGS